MGADLVEMLRDVIFYLGLMSPACFEDLVLGLNFSNVPCIKMAVSKGLGLGIVVGSSLVKLPQVVKIAKSGSAEGISLTGTLLELAAITVSGAYNFSQGFPFSSYGESVFLAAQTSAIGVLVIAFTKGKPSALLFGALYAGVAWALLNPLVTPASMLWYGQAANIPMILLGKIIQIVTNFKNGHTGQVQKNCVLKIKLPLNLRRQLSAITVFLLALGAIARIFTSIQETGDQIVILTYVCSSAVNCIIALQVLVYWNSAAKKKTA